MNTNQSNQSPRSPESFDCPSVSGSCAPDRQQFARDFLAGEAPAVMDRYAPDAQTGPHGEDGWQESDETVERLRRWREEAPYG